MLTGSNLRDALVGLPLHPQVAPWTRAIGHHLLREPPPGAPPGSPPQPLWPGGPVVHGARFTPKGSFGSIYLASDPVTALLEVQAIFSTAGTLKTPPWTVVAVEGFLERVLDVTDKDVLDALETSVAELTGDWRYSQSRYLKGEGPAPPTQSLGQAAYDQGDIIGVRFHSAKHVGEGTNLVVFSDRLVPGAASYLEVYDPHGLIQQRLP